MRTVHPPVIDDVGFGPNGLHKSDHTGENRVGNWSQHRPWNERNRSGRESSLKQRGSIAWRKDCHAIAPLDEVPRQGPQTDEPYRIGWCIRFIPITEEEPPHTSAR